MKKFLLMCFAALLCATNLYAVPGSGTEADPYVVADGDTYNIPAGEKIYIKFSAPSDGTLTLAPRGELLGIVRLRVRRSGPC